ncbi:hypothetical protein [Marinobacter sp.]|jgi:hypothetical protein|uniref:hypothetical protein n=1 Tax=Marinobacter sp. TaxID=50741 RepID=UPI0023574FFA|nr:hypothetical protein [Marinobacter sp.]|tara:strand:+ start:26055 stop:26354 length:300 start_codon:yes stop_codon:yes gene_type:complete
MSRFKVPAPYFSLPPQQYDSSYFADIVRSFAVFIHIATNPGEERATTMTITNLPDNDTGLEVGALFEQNGQLFVTRANIPRPAGLSSTGAVGTVTVTTG